MTLLLLLRPRRAGYPAWAIGIKYFAGDRVSYLSAAYRCLQGHVAKVGWEPSRAPTLWAAV
jgi:streptogrisin C